MIVAGLLLSSLIANAPVESLKLKSVSVLFHPAHTKLVYFCRVAQRCFAAASDTWIFLAIYFISSKKDPSTYTKIVRVLQACREKDGKLQPNIIQSLIFFPLDILLCVDIVEYTDFAILT